MAGFNEYGSETPSFRLPHKKLELFPIWLSEAAQAASRERLPSSSKKKGAPQIWFKLIARKLVIAYIKEVYVIGSGALEQNQTMRIETC